MNKLIASKLNKLRIESEKDFENLRAGKIKSLSEVSPEDFKNVHLAISKEQGHYLRNFIINRKIKRVVEFGASFGLSTIYLADGVKKQQAM